MEIDALVTSVDDPQLERCMYAVRNQTVPFKKVIHLNNVCPQSRAFNEGIAMTESDWVLWVGGDMILDLDAVERMSRYMEENRGDKVAGYYFGVRDTFLDLDLGYIGTVNGPLYRKLKVNDNFANDSELVKKLRRKGWKTRKDVHFVIGTHFDNPDEYQVFKRCYVNPIRHPGSSILGNILRSLQKRTGDPLYQIGLDAIEYGRRKNFYPGSHNLEFDRANYEEWKNNRTSQA